MPMSGPPEMATTTRTAHLAGLDDMAIAIHELKELADTLDAVREIIAAEVPADIRSRTRAARTSRSATPMRGGSAGR